MTEVPLPPPFPPYAAAPKPVHEHSTLTLVFGILSVLACGIFTGIPGIYLGRKGLREVRASNGAIDPGGLRAGYVLSIIGTVFSVLAIALVLLAVALIAHHGFAHLHIDRTYPGTNT